MIKNKFIINKLVFILLTSCLIQANNNNNEKTTGKTELHQN
jgi:hypothetical protein